MEDVIDNITKHEQERQQLIQNIKTIFQQLPPNKWYKAGHFWNSYQINNDTDNHIVRIHRGGIIFDFAVPIRDWSLKELRSFDAAKILKQIEKGLQ